MSTTPWEESQNLVMQLLTSNASDLKDIKKIINDEFRDVRKELRDAMDGHKKDQDGEIEKLKIQIANQNTEIALLKQKFLLIGGGGGALVTIAIELVKATVGHR